MLARIFIALFAFAPVAFAGEKPVGLPKGVEQVEATVEPAEAKPGQLVTVKRADGTKLTFHISRVAQYPKDQFPSAAVYGNLNHPGLRLITCGGSFNSQTGHYRDNIVVFADLIAPTG